MLLVCTVCILFFLSSFFIQFFSFIRYFFSIYFVSQQGVTLWRTRTKLEKYLIIAICTLAIAFIAFLLCIRSSGDAHSQFQAGISVYNYSNKQLFIHTFIRLSKLTNIYFFIFFSSIVQCVHAFCIVH